jgi:hypothetical protein
LVGVCEAPGGLNICEFNEQDNVKAGDIDVGAFLEEGSDAGWDDQGLEDCRIEDVAVGAQGVREGFEGLDDVGFAPALEEKPDWGAVIDLKAKQEIPGLDGLYQGDLRELISGADDL